MVPITWMFAGGLLGAAATAFAGLHGWKAFISNVLIGVAGVSCGGWLLALLTGSSGPSFEGFRLASMFVSLLGAAALLVSAHAFVGLLESHAPLHQDATSAPIEMSSAWIRHQHERNTMNHTMGAGRALHPLITAGLMGIFMLLGACASAPLAPDSAMDAARVAISNAEKTGAGQHAAPELGEAREKLARADEAVRGEEMQMAERFARESQVQAELASARTAATKAIAVNEEMKRGADALAEEIQRAGEPR
jgi:uncharacterized membrane protein YeaQ/YmgE (transglycosylase-associated protein family)